MTTSLTRRPAPVIRKRRAYVPGGTVGRHLQAAQDLQSQIQRLEAQLSHHRSVLLAHLQKQGLARLELGQFLATRKVRHNFSYSPECEREALALRSRQKWEQTMGIAVDSPTEYITFSTRPSSSSNG